MGKKKDKREKQPASVSSGGMKITGGGEYAELFAEAEAKAVAEKKSADKKKPSQPKSYQFTGCEDGISAPYNFVPASTNVVLLDETNISHDNPFPDGITASFDCQLTNESKLYVRNGSLKKNQTDPEHITFFNFDRNGKTRYAVPGASIRGMIRNVVEIASFGKMATGVDNHRYSMRDLSSKIYTGRLQAVQAGWLKIENDSWTITPRKFAKISFDMLSSYRHNLWDQKEIEQRYEPFLQKLNIKATIKNNRVTSFGEPTDTTDGTLVITGRAHGKKNEFFFYGDESEALPVSDDVRKDFLFIHEDSGGWKFWKNKSQSGERVPVFFLLEKQSVHSFGLAQMYRLACDMRIHDTIRNVHPDHCSNAPDLAQAIFGYLDGAAGSLKGRAWFTHAISDNATPADEKTGVLGGPKPPFFPNYLDQGKSATRDGVLPKNGSYSTYMDRNAKARGWKRYPVGGGIKKLPSTGNDAVKTTFTPIEEGAEFSFRLVTHNLRPYELGAILWSLAWGGDEKKRHALGMAKSYGYGKVKISVTSKSATDNMGREYTVESLTKAFADWMENKQPAWIKTEQLKELVAMATPGKGKDKDKSGQLEHMELKCYREAKNKKLVLKKYTIL